MTIAVHLWSYFREVAGRAALEVEVPEGATVAAALDEVYRQHPRLAAFRNSTLVAVGVDYQGPSHVLQPADEVSLFPPVQGG